MPEVQVSILGPAQGSKAWPERKRQLDNLLPIMIELYQQGESVFAIADIIGASYTTAKKRLVKAGIQVEDRHSFGKDHWKWKGGMKDRGYIYVIHPDYKRGMRKTRYIRRSRLVWGNAYGPIPEGCEIHHLNGKKDDDRSENLCLLDKRVHGRYIPQREFIKKLQSHIRELERGIGALKAQQSFSLRGGDD